MAIFSYAEVLSFNYKAILAQASLVVLTSLQRKKCSNQLNWPKIVVV
jgi:hypothetical protein